MDNHSPNPQSAEDLAVSALNRAKQTAEEQIHRAEVYTRESPLAALTMAAAAGYVLRGLPVRALLGVFLRLALVLVRPFIFVFGAMNLYHFLKRSSHPDSSAVEEYIPGETGRHPE